MKTLVLANQKGGVGKSAVATLLAHYFRKLGQRVLAIDLDHQGNFSDPLRKSQRAAVVEAPASALLTQANPIIPAADFVLVAADRDLSGLERQPDRSTAYLLDLLMPHMHLALHRMRLRESGQSGAELAPATLLSKREIQVLHWVKNGKTNMEIGQILGISPPTVKNHLQKVMRKLNVNNRAQAVGKCATLRLMAHSDLN